MAHPTSPSPSPRPTSSSSNSHLSPPTSRLPSLQTSDSNAISSAESTPLNTPRKGSNSPRLSHRSLLTENIRQYPPSPRAQRTQSFSGAALTELLMNPPTGKSNGVDERFKGRDWRTIQVHEIIAPTETRFVELDTSIEDTTKLLIRSGPPNVVLVRESRKTKTAIDTFGYDELTSYLLLVLGMTQPDQLAGQLAQRARQGETLPLKEVFDNLGPRESPNFLAHTASLGQAMEVLGSGLHRVIVYKEGTSEAMGVLSQLRLVRFFWENHQSFAPTEALYSRTLKDLDLGAKVVVAINGDKPLSDALRLMNDEGITSLPVLDAHNNVVGNISHVDTRVSSQIHQIPWEVPLLTFAHSSFLPTRPPFRCSAAHAFTSSVSSFLNEAFRTARMHIRFSMSHHSAHLHTRLLSCAPPDRTECGLLTHQVHRRVSHPVPAWACIMHPRLAPVHRILPASHPRGRDLSLNQFTLSPASIQA